MNGAMIRCRVVALWIVLGSVIGFIWGAILGIFDGPGVERGFFCASIGLAQGLVGGICQASIIPIGQKKLLTRDWLPYGLIAAFPFLVFLLWVVARTKGGNAVEGWFVPLQVIVCTYLTADLVNREIDRALA
jgi:hypothetical protein